MRAIGFPTFRYKLTCFVIAGMICGLPARLPLTQFHQPGDDALDASAIIVMVVMGGMGSVFGPVIGALRSWCLKNCFRH